jgi:hypothetical protein
MLEMAVGLMLKQIPSYGIDRMIRLNPEKEDSNVLQ